MVAFEGDDDLIKMPLVTKVADPGSNPFGGQLAKLQRPGTYRFVRDFNAACGQHFFDHSRTQWITKVKPQRIAIHLGGKTVASLGNRIGWWRSVHVQIFAAFIIGLT